MNNKVKSPTDAHHSSDKDEQQDDVGYAMA